VLCGPWERTQVADVVSTSGGQGATEGEPAAEASLLSEGAIGAGPSVGSRVDSPDFLRNLNSLPRKHSMSNSNGVDLTRLRQLRVRKDLRWRKPKRLANRVHGSTKY
jgi:hypothetical protein